MSISITNTSNNIVNGIDVTNIRKSTSECVLRSYYARLGKSLDTNLEIIEFRKWNDLYVQVKYLREDWKKVHTKASINYDGDPIMDIAIIPLNIWHFRDDKLKELGI